MFHGIICSLIGFFLDVMTLPAIESKPMSGSEIVRSSNTTPVLQGYCITGFRKVLTPLDLYLDSEYGLLHCIAEQSVS